MGTACSARGGLARAAAAAALACGLSAGVALAMPQDASAAAAKLARPAITSVEVNSDSVTIKVKKVKGALGYQAAAYRDGKGKAVKKSSWKTAIKYGDLLDGERYTVKVRAYRATKTGKTVYGKWSKPKRLETKAVTYSISYNPTGGTMPEGDVPTSFARTTPTFKLPTPTYGTRTFLGWNALLVKQEGALTVKVPTTLTEVPMGTTQDLELNAVWSLPSSSSGGLEVDGNEESWLTMDMIENSEKLLELDEATRSAAIEGMASKLNKEYMLSGMRGVRVGSVSTSNGTATVGFSTGLKGWPTTGFEMTITDGKATFSRCAHECVSTVRAYRDFQMESADRYNAMMAGYIFTTSGFSYNPITCSWSRFDEDDIIYGDNCNEWLHDYIFGSYGTAWFTGVPVLEERCDLCGADANPDFGCNNERGNYVIGGDRPYYYVEAPGSTVASHGAFEFTESSWIDPEVAAADRSACAIVQTGL